MASHRIYSKRIPNCVSTKFQLHLVQIILKEFQIVSQLKFHLSHRNYSRTILKRLLVEIPLHLIETIVIKFQYVAQLKIHCISPKIF